MRKEFIKGNLYLTENRCIELHSPDGIHSCVLRASDSQEALAWFNALHSTMARSTQCALLEANRALASILGELKHIGWLSRRIGCEQVSYAENFSILVIDRVLRFDSKEPHLNLAK